MIMARYHRLTQYQADTHHQSNTHFQALHAIGREKYKNIQKVFKKADDMNGIKRMARFILKAVRHIVYSKFVYGHVAKMNMAIRKHVPRLSDRLDGVRDRLRKTEDTQAEAAYDDGMEAALTQQESSIAEWEGLQWREELQEQDVAPLVSIIVPNYNHALYLRERLDTIYNQTYPNFEVILLDDCSTDDSRDILEEYAERYSKNTRILFNDVNSGSVFQQWNKGLSLARGKYIWIAESDDYSEDCFLEEMMKCFRYPSTILAFSRSAFMQDGKQTWSTEEYLANVKTLRWDMPFTITAATAVKLGFGYKNIIPNVSSAVFRNIGQVPEEVLKVCSNMALSSDWIFYLAIMKGGCLSYTNRTTNYYRVHQESTSLRVQRTLQYYDEYEMVSAYVSKNYEVDEGLYEKILDYLLYHYRATQHVADAEIVKGHYCIEELKEIQKHRKPNIAVACFSLQSGGGETYPIYLANELHSMGCNVTLFDFNRERYEEECRDLLNPGVPLVRLRDVGKLIVCLKKMNIDVVHSHHGSVDEIVGKLLNDSAYRCRHIITLHGMYETIEDCHLEHLFDVVGKSCSRFFYIADKNLIPFRRYQMLDKVQTQKIDNGLPVIPVTPVPRESLGIEDNAFVLCIVSRGIAEKGWKEGIKATSLAREKASRPIHLLLVGDGEIRKELEKESPDYVHFLGCRSNVRDYFATSDIGFLPTRFAGESYPLVLIEALMCGKPVIATDVAEVRHQLTDEAGELAGELLTLRDGALDVQEIAESILKLSEDRELYETLQKRTLSATRKFNIRDIAAKYLSAYEEVTGLGA